MKGPDHESRPGRTDFALREPRIVFSLDDKGRFTGTDRAFLSALGYEGVYMPESFESILTEHPDNGEAGRRLAMSLGEEGGEVPVAFEAEVRAQDGSHRWILAEAIGPRADGTGWRTFLALDVTRFKAPALGDSVFRTERLAAMGRISAAIAHEITNPVSSITGYAHMLKDSCSGDPVRADLAGRIIREGEHMAAVVRSLLSFVRDRGDERTACDPADLFREVRYFVSARLRGDGISLDEDIPSSLPPLLAHPQLIQQVILNLISNSADSLNEKYPSAHPRKRIAVSLGSVGGADAPSVRLVVRDSGVGIPEETLGKIFRPFFTTKGRGTGLGLSISKSIVQEHGGSISVTSREGSYTEAVVDLPAIRTCAS